MNIAIYCRTSTGRQSESLETQQIVCNALIKDKFKDKNYIILPPYIDTASGGDTKKRGKLQELISDIKSGKVNAVVVSRFDRSFRNIRHALDFFELCNNHNVAFLSKKEDYDTNNAMGRAMLMFALTLAQMERENVSERIKAHNEARLQNGDKGTGSTPLGYRRENRKLIIHREESLVVKFIYKKYKECGSFSEVRNALMKHGYTYPVEKCKWRTTANDVSWKATTIAQILKNKTYIGIVEYNTHKRGREDYKEFGKGNWTPIISEELFNECQKIMQVNRTKRTNSIINPKQKIPYVYSDVIYCECGRALVGSSSRKYNKDKSIKQYYAYYRCKSCGKLTSSSELDKSVATLIDNVMEDTSILRSSVDEAKEKEAEMHRKIDTKIANTRKKITQYEKERNVVIKALARATDENQEELNKKLNDLSGAIKMSELTVSNLITEKKEIDYDEIYKYIEENRGNAKKYSEMNHEQKREAVKKLVRKITVSEEKIDIDLFTCPEHNSHVTVSIPTNDIYPVAG